VVLTYRNLKCSAIQIAKVVETLLNLYFFLNSIKSATFWLPIIILFFMRSHVLETRQKILPSINDFTIPLLYILIISKRMKMSLLCPIFVCEYKNGGGGWW